MSKLWLLDFQKNRANQQKSGRKSNNNFSDNEQDQANFYYCMLFNVLWKCFWAKKSTKFLV
jgi:hypothetical protein